MANIEVLKETCIGCAKCIRACPYDAIEMADNLAEIDLKKCTLCGACVESCPVDAIVLHHEHKAHVDLDAYKGVWIFAEQRNGKIQGVVFELLNAGKKLAQDRNTELCAVLLGSGVENQAKALFMRGADKVYLAEHDALKEYNDEPYARILT